jgi:hypothetical protein
LINIEKQLESEQKATLSLLHLTTIRQSVIKLSKATAIDNLLNLTTSLDELLELDQQLKDRSKSKAT